jgi:resuscitation-promoting factor RpfA
MSTSSDIKELFGRFGGDASSYREISVENEAHEARDRWPLLGMIDLRRTLPAAAGKSPGETTPDTRRPVASTGAASASAGASTAAAASPPGGTQAALRRSAPLFARSPRRDVAPPIAQRPPSVPESGAFRFSPPPGAAANQEDAAEEAAPRVTREAASPPPLEPTMAPPRDAGLPPFVANLARSAAAPAPAPTFAAQPAQPAPNAAPLRKLFGVAAPVSTPVAPQAAPAAPNTEPADRLDSLFDRLRKGAHAAPTPPAGADPKRAPAYPSIRKAKE